MARACGEVAAALLGQSCLDFDDVDDLDELWNGLPMIELQPLTAEECRRIKLAEGDAQNPCDAACDETAAQDPCGPAYAETATKEAQDACCSACAEPFFSSTAQPAETTGKPEPSLKRLFAASAIAVVAELASIAGALPVWATAAMALIAVLLGGFSTWLSGWRSIRRRKLDINALMSVAAAGAALLQDCPEAALVMVLFALAEALEARSVDRAKRAIAGLLEMAPERASVKGPDGAWLEVKTADIALGTIIPGPAKSWPWTAG